MFPEIGFLARWRMPGVPKRLLENADPTARSQDVRVDTLDPFPGPSQQDAHTPAQDIPLSAAPLQTAPDLVLQDLLLAIRLHVTGKERRRNGVTVRDDIVGALLEDRRVLESAREERAKRVGRCFRVNLL